MPKVINEEEVFAAVIDIFVTKGYEGATTKEIAAAAGMHEATLFRKYGSKAGLIEKAIDAQLSATPLSRLRYTGDLQADLCAIVQAYIETSQAHGPIIPALLTEVPKNSELAGALSRPLANIQGIIDIIQQYQDQGHLRAEPVMMTVSVLIGPIMVQKMTERVVSHLAGLDLDPQAYVRGFLDGRKASPI